MAQRCLCVVAVIVLLPLVVYLSVAFSMLRGIAREQWTDSKAVSAEYQFSAAGTTKSSSAAGRLATRDMLAELSQMPEAIEPSERPEADAEAAVLGPAEAEAKADTHTEASTARSPDTWPPLRPWFPPAKQQKAQSSDDSQPITPGVRFSYRPFLIHYPLFANDEAHRAWRRGSGENHLKRHDMCSKFIPSYKEGEELVNCDEHHPVGNLTDVLLFKNSLSLPAKGCSKFRKEEFSDTLPEPENNKFGTDIVGYDSWSFQHFMEGPWTRVIQNLEYYKKYNAKVLAETRVVTSGSFNNPFVPKILEKAGVKSQLIGHCSGFNTLEPCVVEYTPKVSLACSWPQVVPELAWKWREIMGVPQSLPQRGSVIFTTRNSGAGQGIGGRKFTNDDEIRMAISNVAQDEFGLEVKVLTSGVTQSIKAAADYFGTARLLIGAHGGMLWNFHFMPAGSGMIEISGDGADSFFKHTSRMGLVYAPLKAEMIGNKNPLKANLQVDVDALTSIMRRMLAVTGAKPVL